MEETITYHTCSKCGEEKPLTSEYFAWRKVNISFRKECKECRRKYENKRLKEKREHINNVRKKYYHKRKEEDPNYRKEEKKIYRENNKDIINKKIKEWYYKNKTKRNKQIVRRRKERFNEDPFYKMKQRIRVRTRVGILKRNPNILKVIGCPDWETFIEHIESQFTENMSWDNQGEWHYDHYYPISLAQTEEDIYIFNHYTNFQPLWAKDNLEKSNNVPDGFEEWYESMKEKVSQ